MIDFFRDNPGVWVYLIIPFVSAFVGWFTNLIAIKMTFYPIEFVGLGPWIGWQGIIPSRAVSMANKSVDLMVGKLIDIEERFSRIDPGRVAEESDEELHIISRSIINKIMRAQAPLVWRTTPEIVKESIYDYTAKDLPEAVEQMMEEIRDNVEELFDVKAMVVKTLSDDKALLNKIFLKCGEKEFKFIIRSGFYLGFLFGLIMMTIWYFYNPWWLLPLAGFTVGYATNWLALKMIFLPLNPIKVGPWTIQGLFIKRQKEVAAEYARIVSHQVLTTENIFDNIIYGKANEKLAAILKKHVEAVVEKTAMRFNIFIELLSGKKKFQIVKNIANFHFIDHFPIIIHQVSTYTEYALDLETALEERMSALSPEEFQGFLRPVFQEEEYKLILVGAFLGCVAGFAQLYFMFS